MYNLFYLIKLCRVTGQGDNAVASWELRVEGRLLDDAKGDPGKVPAVRFQKKTIFIHTYVATSRKNIEQ